MFQTGTPINPQLLSNRGMTQGMLQGAGITAQSLAQLGAEVGDAVEKNRKKKEEKKQKGFLSDSFIKMGEANEELGNMILPDFANAEDDDKRLAANTYIEGLGLANATKLNMALLSAFLDDDKEQPSYGELGSFLDVVEKHKDYSIEDGTVMFNPPGFFNKRPARPDDNIFKFEGGQEFLKTLADPLGVR